MGLKWAEAKARSEEIQAIVTVLSLPAGLAVDFAKILTVCLLDSHPTDWEYSECYAVWHWDDKGQIKHEWLFPTPKEAAMKFVALRHKMKLGFDYESAP